jgi:hypothetical protein
VHFERWQTVQPVRTYKSQRVVQPHSTLKQNGRNTNEKREERNEASKYKQKGKKEREGKNE